MRDLENDFGDSTNAIRLELNHFEQASLLTSESKGNKKIYRANTAHPLFSDIHNILLKNTGLDKVVEKVICKLGGVESAFITGRFAKGLDSSFIDLILIGTNLNTVYLDDLVKRTESLVKRNIRYTVHNTEELQRIVIENPEALLLWQK